MDLSFISRLFGTQQAVTPARKILFIHAGSYKTGTTFFQHQLFHNRRKLRRNGLLYPKIGLGLKTPHNKYAHRTLGISIVNGKQNLFPSIIENLNSTEQLKAAYVSYEGFSNPDLLGKLQALPSRFEGVDVQVILVFRPHMDYALSMYRELCKHVGFSGPVTEFFDPRTAEGKKWHAVLDYRSVIEAWADIVGPENLHILSYNQIKSDVTGALLAPTGLKMVLKDPPEQQQNLTLSAPAAAVMRRMNAKKPTIVLRHMMAHKVRELDLKYPDFAKFGELTSDEGHALEERFENDRNYLQAFGFDPAADLKISHWRWGEEAEMTDAVDEFHAALIDSIDGTQNPNMLELAKKAQTHAA
jgi:hypothetical protein